MTTDTDAEYTPTFWLQQQLGFEVRAEGGQALASVECDERHLNPNGVVHGAVIFALIDTAMGAATMTIVPEGAHCATIEIQIRYLAAVTDGMVRVEVGVIKAGRRIVHLQATATDRHGEPVAHATGSFAVLGDPARG